MKIKLTVLLDYLNEICSPKIFNRHNEIKAFNGFSPLNASIENSITWFKGQKLNFQEIKADLIIGPETYSDTSEFPNKIFILVKEPRRTFFQIVNTFTESDAKKGIEKSAIIGKNCTIAESAYISHNVVLMDNVSIGKNTYIHPNVTIYSNVKIGDNCIIHSGTTIGSDGFGYEKSENGDLFKIKHIGGVTIHNNVEIGANTCIDRGTLGNTVIMDNVKIDNLCHIAHNCQIERNSTVIALAMVAGSVSIGENCWISPASSIRNGIKIEKNALVGMGAVVVKDVKENDVVAGVPAKSLKKKKKGE